MQAFGEDVREVTLREPNAGDLQACGYPLLIGADRTVRFDAAAMTQLIVRLWQPAHEGSAKLLAARLAGLRRGDHEFFRQGGLGPEAVDLAYTLAWIWKLDPDRFLALLAVAARGGDRPDQPDHGAHET